MSDATGLPGRVERDSMGEVLVPEAAYWGASTQRALANFGAAGGPLPRRLVRALGVLKGAAAGVNAALGRLPAPLADAIAAAALEVAEGGFDEQFPVDVFQSGSGTSTNMNANEVIANRAAELLGAARGDRHVVHPNDHVNLGQSSNDVIPTAIHLAAILALDADLLPAVCGLRSALEARSRETWDVLKTGRTHLQDATPVRLGQVFLGYAGQMERSERRLTAAREELLPVPLGGTAVGTGLNTHPEFARRVCAQVAEATGVALRETDNHFQAQSTLDACVAASGALRSTAVSLHKIAADLRWLASGPRCGLGEISLPAVQPGSSIMPGKVNPVMAEALLQAVAHVVASDLAITQAGLAGAFELNTMMPLAAHHLIRGIEILGHGTAAFRLRCVDGIQATRRGPELLERSLALATGLVPAVGYDVAAEIAHAAAQSGRTIREVARERTGLPDHEIDRILDPARMTGPST
jgi:fumarate hydratase class II